MSKVRAIPDFNTVLPGQKVSLTFTWNNGGDLSFGPEFVLQIKGSGSDWVKGSWITGPAVAPGATSAPVTVSVVVPNAWSPGAEIELELKMRYGAYFGETRLGYWENALKIPTISSGWVVLYGEPTLKVGE